MIMEKPQLYILSLMKDRRNGPVHDAAKCLLHAMSAIYSAAQSLIGLSYSAGIRREHRAAVPVISVGNITMGGTGKTPFTVLIARRLQDAGKKPAVLIRGYGDDESVMLKDELPDIPVIVGQDRVSGAAEAVSLGRDVIVMDDGFQHRRLARDMDMVLIDGVYAFGNGFLFPRGVMREGPSALIRADIFVITKADMAGEERVKEIELELGRVAPGVGCVITRHRPCSLNDVTGSVHPLDAIAAKKVCMVSAIGDPDYLAFLISGAGASVAWRRDYLDHHGYAQSDVDGVADALASTGAEAVIVTAKDYTKLKRLDISSIEEKLLVLNVDIEIARGKEYLDRRLDSVINGQVI
jgi:tetraacyldisaccharide 4'-kinase